MPRGINILFVRDDDRSIVEDVRFMLIDFAPDPSCNKRLDCLVDQFKFLIVIVADIHGYVPIENVNNNFACYI